MKRTTLVWIFLLCAVAFRVVLPDQAEERPILPDEVEYTVSAVNLIRGAKKQNHPGSMKFPKKLFLQQKRGIA